MDVRHGCAPVGMTKKARRALRYPTQAKTGLEWGTQPLLKVKQSKKVTTSRDDNSEGRLKVIQLGILEANSRNRIVIPTGADPNFLHRGTTRSHVCGFP